MGPFNLLAKIRNRDKAYTEGRKMTDKVTRVMLGIVIVGLVVVSTQLHGLNNRTGELIDKGEAIEKDVETANENMEILGDAATKVDGLTEPLEKLSQRTARFDSVLTQIEGVDGKFDDLEKNVNTLMPIAEALRDLAPKLDSLDARVAGFEDALEEVRGMSAASEKTIAKLDQGLTEMQGLRKELQPLKDLSVFLAKAPGNSTASNRSADNTPVASSNQSAPAASTQPNVSSEPQAPCQTWPSEPTSPGYPPEEIYTECSDGSRSRCILQFVNPVPADAYVDYRCRPE